MSNAITYKELFEASLCIQNNQWTKDILSDLPTCKGVLLFTDAPNNPIQLLQAGNLRRTAQAKLMHEEEGPTQRKADVSNLTYSIYYTCCYNNFLTQLTYTQLAHVVFEKDSIDWIQLPKTSFVVIDLDSFLPYFYVSDRWTKSQSKKRFGLFSTHNAAAEFCEVLNTVFILCRNPSLLNSGKEKSCPYLQMQTCPGPCINTELRKFYPTAVNQAIQTANGNIDTAQKEFQQQMQQASDNIKFELAQDFKKKLEQLNKLSNSDFQYVHPLENLCFLHIDTGPKVKIEGQKKKQQQFMWFKITAKGVFHLGDLVPESEECISQFLEANWSPDKKNLLFKNNTELPALMSLQLFRSKRSGIWIDCTNGIWIDNITSAIGLYLPYSDNPWSNREDKTHKSTDRKK